MAGLDDLVGPVQPCGSMILRSREWKSDQVCTRNELNSVGKIFSPVGCSGGCQVGWNSPHSEAYSSQWVRLSDCLRASSKSEHH